MNRGVGLHVVKAIHNKYLKGEARLAPGLISKRSNLSPGRLKENLYSNTTAFEPECNVHIRGENCLNFANLRINQSRKSSVKKPQRAAFGIIDDH